MNPDFRVGLGLDFHRLEEGEKFVLGGVKLDYPKGMVGHSDADVLTHAVCDAILGSVDLGDIGTHFPDDDPEYEDISSIKLLEETIEKVASRGYEVSNLDTTIIAEEPKLSPYKESIAESLSSAVGVDVSVKATTAEGLGFFGRGEGIVAQAIVAVRKIK